VTKCDLQDSIFLADYTGHTNLSLNSRPFFLCSVEKNSQRGTRGRASNPPGERAFPFIPFPSWQMILLVDKNKACDRSFNVTRILLWWATPISAVAMVLAKPGAPLQSGPGAPVQDGRPVQGLCPLCQEVCVKFVRSRLSQISFQDLLG
jgi:hypothetical protein